MGLMDKLKGIFGKKEDVFEHETPRRLEVKKAEVESDEFTPRWKIAKKEREARMMDEPLVKRNNFKKRL